MKIDFHTHCYPDKISKAAIDNVAFNAGNYEPLTDGTFGNLEAFMQKQGVEKFVVLSIATTPHSMRPANDFAIKINNSNTGAIAFGTIHPDAPDALDELEYIKASGLKGVKLHPEYQRFYIDDERMKPIYRKISSLGLITTFHAGCDYSCTPPYHAMPERLARAVRWFDSPVVAAHWGGVGSGEEVIKRLCPLPIYFDTSFGYGTMARVTAMEIVEKHGADKMLFGSDTPWHSPDMETRLLTSLGLSGTELDMIYYKNAAKLLDIEV